LYKLGRRNGKRLVVRNFQNENGREINIAQLCGIAEIDQLDTKLLSLAAMYSNLKRCYIDFRPKSRVKWKCSPM
jgi:hypothetical protein